MNNEILLNKLCDISKTFDADFVKGSTKIFELIEDVKKEIKRECAKKAGKLSALKAAENIIKQRDEQTDKKHGAYIENNFQIIGGNYCAVRIFEPIPGVREKQKDAPSLDYNDYIIKSSKNIGEVLEMPKHSVLLSYIKEEKAQHKGEKGFVPVWDFGEGKPAVNASYLLDVITILGENTTATAANMLPETSSIYFRSSAGDGLLCPIRKRV